MHSSCWATLPADRGKANDRRGLVVCGIIVVKIIRSAEFLQALTAEGALPVGNTPAEFGALIQSDVRKWSKIIKEAGIRAE